MNAFNLRVRDLNNRCDNLPLVLRGIGRYKTAAQLSAHCILPPPLCANISPRKILCATLGRHVAGILDEIPTTPLVRDGFSCGRGGGR